MKDDQRQTIPWVLPTLARELGTEVKDRRVIIPENYGSGYCSGYVFNEHIRLLILNYELKENLVIENPEVQATKRLILFKFLHVIPQAGESKAERVTPSVLIATSSLNSESLVPIHSNTGIINIEIEAHYLQELFPSSKKSAVLKSLLDNAQPLLFEELVLPSLQKIVDELVNESVSETFELFFARVKTEELICRLLMALEQRSETYLYSLNSQDIDTLYRIKEQMLSQLDTPPLIRELALAAHMSPTKLKRLFKQIFGNSLFSYYQEFRMQEAARLLKEGKRTVSEVGYHLGFTNLSHFSRVFYEHIGTKPKQFSRS